jgi:hypothetical protein
LPADGYHRVHLLRVLANVANIEVHPLAIEIAERFTTPRASGFYVKDGFLRTVHISQGIGWRGSDNANSSEMLSTDSGCAHRRVAMYPSEPLLFLAPLSVMRIAKGYD